jgi:hypothetical protein
VRFDPRTINAPRTKVATVKTLSSGDGLKQEVVGTNIKVTMAFPGLIEADAWTVFADGRIAIVRGSNYRIEFINPDGKRGVTATIPYERIRVTEADKAEEMKAVRKQIEDQRGMMKNMIPPGYTIEMDVTPPAAWPSVYPPLSPLGALAAPDGRLWVKRAVPARIDREQWDVIDRAGKLVARWQLPPKINIIALGTGVVYATRTDADDLRYVQRIDLPR